MKHLSTKKDKKKFYRGIVQGIILIGIVWLIINSVFSFKKYIHFDSRSKDLLLDDKGFIALSYIAVDNNGTNTMISKERLDEHFSALNRNGYATIKQTDIEQYYKSGKILPEKSMFLMFEDGRKDTAIFGSYMLEKYNFIGTILSYGDRLKKKDLKFLGTKDFEKLEKSSFWELGTNGYRLSYINAYDRYDNFLGGLNYLEYTILSKYFKRNYNHYLMDFIRDEDKVPKETYDEMVNRINKDYELMEEVYREEFGEVPKTYVIMHANTGAFGSNEKVSDINEKCINKLFTINFNREGYSHNNIDTNIYDLTRMQPQAYWYANHLLMRIQEDTKENVEFIYGDLKQKEDWDILKGAPEYKESVIALTSNAKGTGLIRLKNSEEYKDYKLSITLTGNKLGSQSIYLRADEKLERYVSVRIQNNILYIEENKKILYELDLDKHDGIIPMSLEEDESIILNKSLEVYEKYSKDKENPTRMEHQERLENEKIRTVEEGGEEYIPEIQIHEKGKRNLEIHLRENKISVKIDNKIAAADIKLLENSPGYIYLESAWGEYGYSQRNITDDVYDGVFKDLFISDVSDDSEVIYTNRLEGINKLKSNVILKWNEIINWFVKNF